MDSFRILRAGRFIMVFVSPSGLNDMDEGDSY